VSCPHYGAAAPTIRSTNDYLGSIARDRDRAENARFCPDPGFLARGRSAGMQVPKFVLPTGGLVALPIAACAGDSAVLDNLLIMPSRFDTLECSELVGQFQSASQRLYELTMLRENAASALAYDTEYAKAKATKKYSEAAANRKGCDLSKKTPASAVPRPEGSTGSHPHAEHPQPGRSGISQ
jgi:hypothetical protein